MSRFGGFLSLSLSLHVRNASLLPQPMSYDRVRSRMRCRMMKSAKTNSLLIPADFRDEREEIVDEDSESEKL